VVGIKKLFGANEFPFFQRVIIVCIQPWDHQSSINNWIMRNNATDRTRYTFIVDVGQVLISVAVDSDLAFVLAAAFGPISIVL
jgi:hypothetical protein